MIRIFKAFLVICVFLSFPSCAKKENKEWNGFPLATPADLPPGKEATPKEAGVKLGNYKTCREYGDFVIKQFNFVFRMLIKTVGTRLQDLSTVECRQAHTCHCQDDYYFTDRLGEDNDDLVIYRCIENSSAGVEKKSVYEPNESFSKEGVIKFALPRSYCQK